MRQRKGPREGPFRSTPTETRRARPATSAGSVVELVAALEHRGDAGPERARALRQLAEAVLGDAHLGERVVLVRVEAGRDEDELRLEARDGRLDRLLERAQVLRVARARPAAGR